MQLGTAQTSKRRTQEAVIGYIWLEVCLHSKPFSFKISGCGITLQTLSVATERHKGTLCCSDSSSSLHVAWFPHKRIVQLRMLLGGRGSQWNSFRFCTWRQSKMTVFDRRFKKTRYKNECNLRKKNCILRQNVEKGFHWEYYFKLSLKCFRFECQEGVGKVGLYSSTNSKTQHKLGLHSGQFHPGKILPLHLK